MATRSLFIDELEKLIGNGRRIKLYPITPHANPTIVALIEVLVEGDHVAALRVLDGDTIKTVPISSVHHYLPIDTD